MRIYKALWLEWFKLRKRLATWGVYIGFLTLTMFVLGVPFYSARHRGAYWGFPEAWEDILTLGAPIASIFGAVLVALTVSSEFEWRTCRQNVIDGLSKDEWFLGKLLSVPGICVALYGTQIILGAVLAFLDTHPAHKAAVSYPLSTYVMTGAGALLGMSCYSLMALLISIGVRSAGPAIGLTLIYQVFDYIAARTLRGFELDGIAALLPFQVNIALLEFKQYLPQPSRALDYHWSTPNLLLAGIIWAAAFAATARWLYLRRDL